MMPSETATSRCAGAGGACAQYVRGVAEGGAGRVMQNSLFNRSTPVPVLPSTVLACSPAIAEAPDAAP